MKLHQLSLRYQRGNQNQYIKDKHTTQWQKKQYKRTNNDLPFITFYIRGSCACLMPLSSIFQLYWAISIDGWFGWFMVFNATFNIITVLFVEETGVPGENQQPVASQCQTLSHNVVSSTPRHERDSNSQL